MATHERGRVVVIALDGSKASGHAFDTYMSTIRKDDDSVVLVACQELSKAISSFWKGAAYSYDPDLLKEKLQDEEKEKKAMLKPFGDRLLEHGIKSRPAIIVTKEPGHGITSTAESEKADLIVVGSRGHGTVARMLLGSCSDYVIKHASIPVVLCRQKE